MTKQAKKEAVKSKKKQEKVRPEKTEFMTPEQTLPTEMLETTLNPLFLSRAIEPEISPANKLRTMPEDFDELELQDILPKTARPEAPASPEVVESDHDPVKKFIFGKWAKSPCFPSRMKLILPARWKEAGKFSSEPC